MNTKKDKWKEEMREKFGQSDSIEAFIESLLSQQNYYLRSEVEKMKMTSEPKFNGTVVDRDNSFKTIGYNQALEDILKMMSEKHE